MDNIGREREHSLKFVQIVFAVIALLSLGLALAAATRGVDWGLPEASIYPIALAFLLVGAVDTVLLYAWEHIFQRTEL